MGFLLDRIKNRMSRWSNDESRVNDSDLIFSLSSSHITLDRKVGLVTTGRCVLVIKTNGGQYFCDMERGFSNQILAAVFQFYNERDNNQSSFLIYDYKRNKFYPFVPVSHKRKTRNTTEEMRIMETMADEIPFEKDKDLWHPLWNLPL